MAFRCGGLVALLLGVASAFSACVDFGPDAVADAGRVDAGRSDAGVPGADAGGLPAIDAGRVDAGGLPPVDAGGGDAGLSDAGPVEPGPTDAGQALVDAGAPSPPAPPPPSGQIVIEACAGLTGVDETCTLVTNASACTGAPCSRLVVVFSGGEMGCASGAGYSGVLAGYAANGYAALCVNYFETEEGSGAMPYVDEAARIDLALREATTGPWAQAYWTGEDLLLEGISHGATAPLILMARTELDLQTHWRGTRKTAGCFFDGIYDPVATADLLATGGIGGAPCGLYPRFLERYCGEGATAATCDLPAQPKVQVDTITGVLPVRFALPHYRMFECGSGLRACIGDLVAGEPIEELCSRLDASPLRSCTFSALPFDSHLTCHADHFDTCRTWFEALPVP